MSDGPFDAFGRGQRHAIELAGEMVAKSSRSPEQICKMLTADVGHTDSAVIYRENKLAVHRYAPETVAHETPIVIVYALVNRPYILDLQPDRSVIRRLVEAGFAVYLVDWGEPSILDRSLTLADYVDRYLENCLAAVCADAGVEDVHLLGYCMGGSMAIMYTALDDTRVRTLGLMATPLAFDGTGGILERWATHYDPAIAVETLGNMPAELLAYEFSMMDPVEHYVSKYVRLFENLEDDDFVENFARMERWIWDGVDVAGAAFREFVADVYKDNDLVEGRFHLNGERVDLAAITVPTLQVVGQYDHIVPPASGKPLHDRIGAADDRLIEFPAGHIGISVSSKAHERLWPAVAEWFAARSPRDRPADRTARSPGEEEAGSDSPAAATVEAVSSAAATAVAGDASPDGGAVDPSDPTAGVETVRGIGPTFGERLRAAGIRTRADLANRDAATLATAAETGEERARGWLEAVE